MNNNIYLGSMAMASLDEERQEFLSSDKAKNLSLLDFRPLNLGLLGYSMIHSQRLNLVE